MKRIILIAVYAFILYILPFTATNLVFYSRTQHRFCLVLFHVQELYYVY